MAASTAGFVQSLLGQGERKEISGGIIKVKNRTLIVKNVIYPIANI